MRWLQVNWTPERKTAVRELWGKGYSAGQIAGMLDIITTRNAVIGLVHRQGYTRPLRPKPPKPEPKPMTMKPPPPPAPPAPPIPAGFLNLPLEDLHPWNCRWPAGGDRDTPYTFCGQVAREGSPYCHDHHRKAYSR